MLHRQAKRWLDIFVCEYTSPSAETAARIERVCEYRRDDGTYADITGRLDGYRLTCVAAAIEVAELALSIDDVPVPKARDKYVLDVASVMLGE